MASLHSLALWSSIEIASDKLCCLSGADSPGTLFDDDAVWNLDRLPNCLRLIPDLAGVNRSFLYMGM